jgi:lipid-binding SYLF domain-containing protein
MHIAPPGAPDRGIPDNIFRSAKCIVVVPNLTEGGFIGGTEHGREFLHASCAAGSSEGITGVFG